MPRWDWCSSIKTLPSFVPFPSFSHLSPFPSLLELLCFPFPLSDKRWRRWRGAGAPSPLPALLLALGCACGVRLGESPHPSR